MTLEELGNVGAVAVKSAKIGCATYITLASAAALHVVRLLDNKVGHTVDVFECSK